MIWKSLFYLHILQAELTYVDFWKNSVLFRIRGLIPNLCEGKGIKSCTISMSHISLLRGIAKRKLKCTDLHLMSSHLHIFRAFYVWKPLQLFLYHLIIKRRCIFFGKTIQTRILMTEGSFSFQITFHTLLALACASLNMSKSQLDVRPCN